MPLLGIELEAIMKRKPEDNDIVEALHGHFKTNYVLISEPMSFAETKLMLSKAVKHYNQERPHSSLGYMTTSEFRSLKEMEARQ